MELLSHETLNRAADCLRVLGHPMRIRMVDILAGGPRPVNELAEMCDLPPHQACAHLRLLKSHGGHKLVMLGQEDDILTAAQFDRFDIVPRLDPRVMRITT